MADRVQALRDEIAAAHADLLAAVERLPEERLAAQTANEGWTARDVLAHLSSIEPRLHVLWQCALDGQPMPADLPDLDRFNATCVAERRGWPLARLLAEYRETASASDRFLARLTPADLDRPFQHPTRGAVTLEILARIIPAHTRAHLAEIQSAAEA